ncbi:uncharacterized protein A1O9_09463 [Exophiala aquamarina CBS 119918]|uniref:Nucleoporin Nup54 alpha-helical domain-containing protein n=1 Tax=Exophiala aquamarina CBS 119918 TaxID=1182545 RepID=A0A072P3P3_9EURO|nr:uncharacterized protein A1O9_09463 [Exophiala aquamarina CBS 119918]KEF54297.1 hypothetical protein A1O9_09463 [Exophiala aquamarina CBS 119918]
MSFFNNPQAQVQPAKSNLFSQSSIFNQPQNQQAQQTQQPNQQPSQPGGGLFAGFNFGKPSSQPQPQASIGPFGASATQSQPQNQTGTGLFGAGGGGVGGFGASMQQQPAQTGGMFGLSTQQQPQTQRPLDQTLRFGQSQQGQSASPSMWEEGRGLNVFRSIPAQMNIVKNKWDPQNLSSPLRGYLYQHVGSEAEAFKYRAGPDEDEDKWEEAVNKRPGPEWVPLLVRGFFELGRKAQIQMEAIQRCNMMLQEINASLDAQLNTHRQNVAARLEECNRRQVSAAQRTLALAVKVQTLRNRGYVMDNAEEELKAKLENLQREVFDPSLNAREQEIWARMLAIRERTKRIKVEMERIAPTANEEDSTLDEETIVAARKTLEAYDTQLRHLHKELNLVSQEFADWEAISKDRDSDIPRRR